MSTPGRRAAWVAVAALALCAAALLVVLARGAFAVGREVDAAGRTPGAGLTPRDERGPARRAAEWLAGVSDDRALVEARELVALAALPGTAPNDALALHARAVALLAPVARDRDDPRRSRAANLIGSLYLADAALDPSAQARATQQAAEAFHEAVRADPSNSDAKRNLELVLAQLSGELDSAPEPRGGGGTSGAGERQPGSGY
jgi:hypothetical protein